MKHLWVGTPADAPERDVVNATFDAGLTIIFDDVAGHDAYGDRRKPYTFSQIE